jgi:chromosome segregation protein
VNDIRSELETQLRRLQRQSQAARRYQKLKDEEHTVNGELLALRHKEMTRVIEGERQQTTVAEANADSKLADQRELERTIEEIRAKQLSSQEGLSAIQGDVYAVGADIASIEQRIEHARQTEQQQRSELQRLEVSIDELLSESEVERARKEVLELQISVAQEFTSLLLFSLTGMFDTLFN